MKTRRIRRKPPRLLLLLLLIVVAAAITLSLYDETGLSADVLAEYQQQLFAVCHNVVGRLPAAS